MIVKHLDLGVRDEFWIDDGVCFCPEYGDVVSGELVK